jgi:hypothetical protein
MRTGIIAEGKTDLAVIRNILKGRLGIDQSDIQYFSPELRFDETDLSQMQKSEFSNWTIVKKHCQDRIIIHDFLENSIDDNRFLVIQIDAAERNEIGFDVKSIENKEIRQAVLNKIQEWLEYQFIEKIAFAISVEETDAWILAIYESGNDLETGIYPRPKERLERLINGTSIFNDKQKKQHFQKDAFEQANVLSADFRKLKKLEIAAAKNLSLKLFCEDLDKFKINITN